MTNLKKTKEEIIYEILLSLNKGGRGYVEDRVEDAIEQYEELVEEGIIKEGRPDA